MSYVPAKKNTAYTFYVGLVSQSDSRTLQANPTLAAGDVKVAIDDGAPDNLATLPVADADFTKRVKVVLSSDEMNGDNISVIFSDASGAEWCDLIVNIQTVANQIDDLDTTIDDLHTDVGTVLTNIATVDGKIDTMDGILDNLHDTDIPDIHTDLGTVIADLATVDGLVDGIKTKTDQLTFTTPNVIDASVDISALALEASVQSVIAKTDQLTFTTPNKVDATITGGAGGLTAEEHDQLMTTLTLGQFVGLK